MKPMRHLHLPLLLCLLLLAVACQAAPPATPTEPARPRGTYEQRLQRELMSSVRQCFAQNQAHGTVSVQVSVAHDGRITTSRVVNDGTGNAFVSRCISGALVGRRVAISGPRSGGTYTVSFRG